MSPSRDRRPVPERPPTPPEFRILLVLARQQAHGYAILRELEELGGDGSRLGPATLYRSLQGLLERGWIVESGSLGVDERRRTYEITAQGRAMARAEAIRLQALIQFAKASDLLGKKNGVREGLA